MTDEHMEKMQAQMAAMQATMKAIESEQDSEKSAELMRQHVQQMQSGMKMMDQAMMGSDKKGSVMIKKQGEWKRDVEYGYGAAYADDGRSHGDDAENDGADDAA